MTEAEWMACTDATAMQAFVQKNASQRKLRLFAVACCRRSWHLLLDGRSRNAVVAAEQFADGEITGEQLKAAWEAARRAAKTAIWTTEEAKGEAKSASAQASLAAWVAAWPEKQIASFVVKGGGETAKKAWDEQAPLFQDIFGNPFRRASLDRAVLTWNDATIVRLAQAAYDERQMPEGTLDNSRLGVLADALEEAGCNDPDILNHCRQPGEHVRGCWVVDALLGKT